MRLGGRTLLLALLAILALPAMAGAVVLPTGGSYGGTTIEHHYRFVGFHFREPNRNSGGEITNFALRSQSCHSSSCERVILDRGHVSNDGEMSTSQNGVHVTAKWHDHYFVKGTISTGGSTVHYEANLFSP